MQNRFFPDPFISVPFIPNQVATSDLVFNGKFFSLLPGDQIAKLKGETLANGVRYSKDFLNKDYGIKTKYSVVRIDGVDFAIYEGGEKSVGKGGFGTAKIAQNLETGDWYILKTMMLNRDNLQEDIKKKSVEHERLKELGLAPDSPIAQRFSPSKKKEQYSVMMKLAPGTSVENLLVLEKELGSYMSDMLLMKPLISPQKRLQIASNMIEVAAILIEKGYAHRDIKPGNMMTDIVNTLLQYIDFGFTEKFNEQTGYRGGLQGTYFYLAPELLDSDSPLFDEATQVYALGVALAEFFHLLKHPFPLISELRLDDLVQSIIAEPDLAYESQPKISQKNEKAQEVEEKAKEKKAEEQRPFELIDKDDDELFFNDSINDNPKKKILLAVHALVNKMTDKEPKNRGSFREAQAQMQAIMQLYEKEMKPEKTHIKVAVLNIDDYLNADKETKNKILDSLFKYDEIFLVDHAAHDPIYYAAKKQVLEKDLQSRFKETVVRDRMLESVRISINNKLDSLQPPEEEENVNEDREDVVTETENKGEPSSENRNKEDHRKPEEIAKEEKIVQALNYLLDNEDSLTKKVDPILAETPVDLRSMQIHAPVLDLSKVKGEKPEEVIARTLNKNTNGLTFNCQCIATAPTKKHTLIT